MKTIVCLLFFFCGIGFGQSKDDRFVLIPWNEVARDVPVFFSAKAEVKASIRLDQVTSEQLIEIQVHQGKAKVISLELVGKGEVTEVSGAGLKDWSVRNTPNGQRFLDLHTSDQVGAYPKEFNVMVKTMSLLENGSLDVLVPGPAEATGFALQLSLLPDAASEVRVVQLSGMEVVDGSNNLKFIAAEKAALKIKVIATGAEIGGLEMLNAGLTGKVSDDGKSVSFQLDGRVQTSRVGASVEVLAGGGALTSGAAGDGWHVVLKKYGSEWVYELVAERTGVLDVRCSFDVPISRKGDWRAVSFNLPAGVVVPVQMQGLEAAVAFDAAMAVVPSMKNGSWRGYLPVSGKVSMAWKPKDQVADGSLFFASTETADVRVGSGLLRQRTVIDLNVLQGKLNDLNLLLHGPGEVLSVTGSTVLGWKVQSQGEERKLNVMLSRPIEGAGSIVVESQAALAGFPVKTGALRITPSGALRHSGWLRVANQGSVRIEVADAKGLIQLTLDQFPGGSNKDLRQVFVYRFPSADYDYMVHATQVLPEIGLTEVTVYELGETDLKISSDMELDIREAPVREWEFEIPADYAVAAVTGAQVADYVVASEVNDEMRVLKVIFKNAVMDRQLVQVLLEKNQSAQAGKWKLLPLRFPEVKSRRGYIGALAAAGFRLTADQTAEVAEVPVTFFPKKTPSLQQAFRLREKMWSVDLTVEALGQSVLVDVFHLYSLKSGAASGSVLMNFFVVGSPATEWKISVPEGIGNIDVTGQYVGRDWRQEGNTVIVPLSRPVLGAGTLLLTFEQPMNSRGGKISPGEVRPLGVQGERGIVQVVSPLQVNQKSISDGALLAIDPSEIPTEFRLLSSAPTLGAWQYTAREFNIRMDIEWFKPGETIDQVIDFQKLSSQVSRDGQWVTDARIFVKTRGRSALRMQFPEGTALWEAKVSGAAVNARSDGEYTLVPLSSQFDPHIAVEVSLRYGATAKNPRHLVLCAPLLDAPVVLGEWTVTGDERRQLVPSGGSADLVKPVQAESGWHWLARKQGLALLVFVTGLLGMFFGMNKESRPRVVLAILLGIGFIILTVCACIYAAATTHAGSTVLEYAAPVVAANKAITVEVRNLPFWVARTGWAVWLGFLLGAVIGLRGILKGDRIWIGVGLVAVVSSFLSIRGGAPLFFGVLASVGLFWLLPILGQCLGWIRKPKVSTAAMLALMLCLISCYARAAEVPDLKPVESMRHDWSIRDGRLFGQMDVTVRGQAGDRFLLLKQPAVLSEFQGAGIRVVKAKYRDADAYWMLLEASGRLSGKVVFEMPLDNPASGWELPTGPAAIRQVAMDWNQVGWEFTCSAAVSVQAIAVGAEIRSAAAMVLGPVDQVNFAARPVQRDAAAEVTKFFAEASNLFVPGPGVVSGRHRVTIRPTQGRVTSLLLKVPRGFTVSDVVDGPVGNWRFDPTHQELRLSVEPAQIRGFDFIVETQRGAGEFPVDLELEPIRVNDAAGEVGLVGIAFGEDVQSESVKLDGLSRVNPEDFEVKLLPRNSNNQPLAQLQHVFRYGTGVAMASIKVNSVPPELRVESWQLVSLGEDRLVIATDLTVMITRSGVFRLDFNVPQGLEIESATGDGLSHWTQTENGARRIVTLHLAGKTMGQRNFNLTLTGRPTGAQENWMVPKVSLLGASRETGVLTVVPERGLRVRAVERMHVSQIDPSKLIEQNTHASRAAVKPGALAYRLLQSDWSLGLSILSLDPWVTAQVFHDSTIREGQLLSKVAIGYQIENAAVKSQQIMIPGLNAELAATLRATGPAVADLIPVAGKEFTWEIRFQRGIVGSVDVALEYQGAGNCVDAESIVPIVLDGVRQVSYLVAVRAGGRLELEVANLPRGWTKTDWSVVQSLMGKAAGSMAPTMTFRASDPEGPLPVIVKRHELAELQKLRVSQGDLTTLMSPSGNVLTAVNLQMQVVGKGSLRLKLPKGAELFNVLVNGEGASLVREEEDWLFYVSPSPDAEKATEVRFVYSSAMGKGTHLEGPVINVPMENLSWRVLVPEGWVLADYRGDFDLMHEEVLGSFKLEDYRSFVASKRRSDAKSAVAQLDQANAWLAAGDQQKASIALSNAVNGNRLDAASGEDARVQLRRLKTQQAVLGLNSRRQKMVVENQSGAYQADDNQQLERAAEANPVLQGRYNYDPQNFEQFFEGNTADENAALKEIANKMVVQQMAAEPAPVAIDVNLPERGKVLSFGRSVQLNGARPMALEIELAREGRVFAWIAVLLCLLAGAMGVVKVKA